MNVRFKCPVCHKRRKDKIYYDPLGDSAWNESRVITCSNCHSVISLNEYMKLSLWDKLLFLFLGIAAIGSCCFYLVCLTPQHISIVIH